MTTEALAPATGRQRLAAFALSTSWRRAMVIVISMRLALGLVAWLSLVIAPDHLPAGDWATTRTPDGAAWWWLIGPWQRWDGLWFQHLAESGYRAGTGDAAFFPLYPAVTHLLGIGLGGDEALAGLVVSTLSLIVALALLDEIATAATDAASARRAVLLMALAPTALFLLAGYSESLFLALSIGAVLAARRRHWAVAGGAGLLAALCRSTGVLVAVPLLVEASLEMRNRQRAGQYRLRAAHGWCLAPIAGLALYFWYAVWVLDVPGGPAGAGLRWGQHPQWPWVAIVRSAQTILTGTHLEEIANLAAVVLLVVGCTLMSRRLPASFTAYALVSIPVLCFRTAWLSPLMSADRYVLAVFPLFILGGRLLRRTWMLSSVLVLSAALLCTMLVAFTHDLFVG